MKVVLYAATGRPAAASSMNLSAAGIRSRQLRAIPTSSPRR
jgi:hypothetical protein